MTNFSGLLSAISNIMNQLNSLENKFALLAQKLDTISEQTNRDKKQTSSMEAALLSAGWQRRSELALGRHIADPRALPRPVATPMPMDAYLEKLRELEPSVYPAWQTLFDNGAAEYEKNPEASSSVWTHHFARLFNAYVLIFSRGHLLDIGCGTSVLPSYLAGYPSDLISGLEPLEPHPGAAFEIVRGFNEFLPWPDNSFQTVVSGTSLDHVLSLEASLSEVQRVMTIDGIYLVWLASISGSKPYRPRADGFAPVDQYHLFHFDREWIEPLFAEYFEFADITVINQVGFDHVFYALRKRNR